MKNQKDVKAAEVVEVVEVKKASVKKANVKKDVEVKKASVKKDVEVVEVKKDVKTVEVVESSNFSKTAKFADGIQLHKQKGISEPLHINMAMVQKTIKQMVDVHGKPSPRWYFYINEAGQPVILELKTNNKPLLDAKNNIQKNADGSIKKQRVAYHYPVKLIKNAHTGHRLLEFENGVTDRVEVSKQAIQKMMFYIIENESKIDVKYLAK